MGVVAASATATSLSGGAAAEPTHAVYAEGLGKGGLYGVGYDLGLTRRLGLGAVASYYVLGGDRFTRLAPYVTAYPWRGARHGWFVQAGPLWVHRHTPSPGPEWQGRTTASVDAEVSMGYEYRRGVLLRGYVMGALGERFAPWLGVSVGWAL